MAVVAVGVVFAGHRAGEFALALCVFLVLLADGAEKILLTSFVLLGLELISSQLLDYFVALFVLLGVIA